MIAGNNICAKRYLGLVEKFGLKFVQLAGEKMIADSESKARAKLRSMPDGTWMTRQYVTTLDRKTRKSVAHQLYCTMTKKRDELLFDFTGTSPQTDTDHNSTLPSTVAHLALALARCGSRVGILDGDIYGPNVPMMLGLGAILFVHLPAGFFLPNGSEFALSLFGSSLFLALAGAGSYSVDARIGGRGRALARGRSCCRLRA